MSDNYRASLDYLKSLDPENSLIKILEKGENLINRKILDKELAKLPPPLPRDENQTKEKDPIRQRFAMQIRNQIAARAKLSNQFILCKTDEERKELSKMIIEINDKINVLKQNMDYYESNKKLPEMVADDRFKIPENPIDLMMKLNSLRSNISQVKKELRSMLVRKTDQSIISDKEQHLSYLKMYLAYVEQAIERQALHG
jgi:hypothetical protein